MANIYLTILNSFSLIGKSPETPILYALMYVTPYIPSVQTAAAFRIFLVKQPRKPSQLVEYWLLNF